MFCVALDEVDTIVWFDGETGVVLLVIGILASLFSVVQLQILADSGSTQMIPVILFFSRRKRSVSLDVVENRANGVKFRIWSHVTPCSYMKL